MRRQRWLLGLGALALGLGLVVSNDGGTGQQASAQAADPVLVGAGDIADCSRPQDEATAALLDNIPGTVFTTGDNAYENGSAEDYANCYDPTWGRHKTRTRPVPGNHEYRSLNAVP